MEAIREYVIDTILNNIKENIKMYYNNSDKYFNDLKSLVEVISETDDYLKFFIENSDPLMVITESTLLDINRVPYLYDFRDGI